MQDEYLQYDLASFIGKTFDITNPGSPYLPNWHIELIAEYLLKAENGHIKRLIINMPPRMLKSHSVSVAWPAWLLGHNPKRRILAASYASSLSLKHSLDCRQIITSPWYRKHFPHVRLARDQNEKHKFMTTVRGFRLATSIGGSITGEGGDFLLIDDPLTPMQAMNSSWRGYVNQWFDHTFASRLDDKRRGAIVLVMQRLHNDDLTGYLMKKGGWEQLVLPAIATKAEYYDLGTGNKQREKGELLHIEREGKAEVDRACVELGSAAFAAQYQQEPLPEEGNMLKASWFIRHEEAPKVRDRCIQSWDTAIKGGAYHDASVCLTFAECNGRSILLDARNMRLEYPDLKRAFVDLAAQWQPDAILIEDKASGQQLLQDMKRETCLPVIGQSPRYDKVSRFAAVTAMIEAGRVSLPEQAVWLAEFEAELYAFPNGVHDDYVDALTQYLHWLRQQSWQRLRVRSI